MRRPGECTKSGLYVSSYICMVLRSCQLQLSSYWFKDVLCSSLREITPHSPSVTENQAGGELCSGREVLSEETVPTIRRANILNESRGRRVPQHALCVCMCTCVHACTLTPQVVCRV